MSKEFKNLRHTFVVNQMQAHARLAAARNRHSSSVESEVSVAISDATDANGGDETSQASANTTDESAVTLVSAQPAVLEVDVAEDEQLTKCERVCFAQGKLLKCIH